MIAPASEAVSATGAQLCCARLPSGTSGRSRSVLRRAFSLVEVVIATGVFALAVTAVLGLLPALTRQSSDSGDSLTAQRLPDSIRLELQRLSATGGFDALANSAPIMSAPLLDGLTLVAPRDGARLHSLVYLPPPPGGRIQSSEQYFLVEVWRFNRVPLSYDPLSAVLPLYARVSWPYRVPGSADVTPLADRQQITFAVSLTR
jgi:hypothetical protein